ncbi:NUDIX domain-containing protein [Streptacidiphilus rugosus]|uniref:NUDIX domain-containing protein n=1 Tax=Streptacidiphilus rugosus TaxID=405783 RepID=UPI000689DECB|nr:NUDIX domain-containing protein [Streptacidiphilus rugosus]
MPRITYLTEPFEHIRVGDAVVIVAVDDRGLVAMVRQNLPLHGESLSVPGGMIDPGEEPAAAAARELAEETGLRASSWRTAGVFAPMTTSTQRLHFFEATGLTLGEPDRQPNEVAQGMTLEWWPLGKAVQAVWDGQVKLSGSALALLAYAARNPVS